MQLCSKFIGKIQLYIGGFVFVNNQTSSNKLKSSMRKIIGLIILLIQFSCAKPPRDSATLIIQYQPEKTYNQTVERTTNTLIKYKGSAKSLQILKKRGLQNPTISNKKSHTEWVLKTGKLMDKTDFPVRVEYVNTVRNDDQKEIPVKANLTGKFLSDHLPVFDAVVSDGMDENHKMALLQSLQNTFTQLSFPEKKVKIGEQITIENPTSMPMEGSTIEMVVTTNYQLISIAEGIAQFDILQKYTMNPKLSDNSFNGSVTGKGHLVYDIANTIVLNYNLDTEMNITKKLDSFEFELKTNSEIVQTTMISKE